MNPLQRAIIEKAGNDNGFEHVLASGDDGVNLASARHPTHISVIVEGDTYQVHVQSASETLRVELERSFPRSIGEAGRFVARGEAALAALLRRAANLGRALPSQAATNYQQSVTTELAALPAGIVGTEIERLVRQRVGQNKFRDAMLDYWGGACAVTGIATSEVLRASHAKPWAECGSDAERLDVFNGFLLSANLDALFDRFLITFNLQGDLQVAPSVSEQEKRRLGIDVPLRLRWIAAEHLPYLRYHWSQFSN